MKRALGARFGSRVTKVILNDLGRGGYCGMGVVLVQFHEGQVLACPF